MNVTHIPWKTGLWMSIKLTFCVPLLLLTAVLLTVGMFKPSIPYIAAGLLSAVFFRIIADPRNI